MCFLNSAYCIVKMVRDVVFCYSKYPKGLVLDSVMMYILNYLCNICFAMYPSTVGSTSQSGCSLFAVRMNVGTYCSSFLSCLVQL